MLKGGIVSKLGMETSSVDDDACSGRIGGNSGPRRGTSLGRLRGGLLPRLPGREDLCFWDLRGADPSIDGEASFAAEADVIVAAQTKASRPVLCS